MIKLILHKIFVFASILFFVAVCAVILVCVVVYFGTPKNVEASAPTIHELIREIAPKYKVPVALAEAIVRQESGGRNDAIKFEAGQMKRAAKFSHSVEQQRMLASSHGYFQVMGYHAIEKQLSWLDLYNPEINTEVAMALLHDCLKRHESRDRVNQIKKALECYNGSSEYADRVFNDLASRLLEKSL